MRFLVFLDAETEILCAGVASEANAVGDSVEIVQYNGSLIQAIRQKDKQQQDMTNVFTCFITETKTLEDADVVYALYCRRLPVLSLANKHCAPVLLLETMSSLGVDQSDDLLTSQLRALKAFFLFKSTRSQVIVLEGGDGVGKATQTKLLMDHLRCLGHRTATLEFPSEKSRYGGLLREILSGKKGGIQELDPKLFSLIFALNRFACFSELRYWMLRGTKIVLDRYYTANYGHQASKFPEEKRIGFIHNLQLMEVTWLGLPPANVVFYLDLPPDTALSAMKADRSRGHLDIHETAQHTYKEDVRNTYLWCCQELPNWIHIKCSDETGLRQSREATHDLICNALKGMIF
ncbi:putative thymidylate kinase [Trypanosoma grayi]|uniref:putative thymidylate kinase n=1 Tax=Trypanosoma grayi TaxID=71804 RepID=UPI0004F438F0|nr:putative thymidylate kinase [Trypanosoma grayi]KEG12915.1 putative thymidylate kinase [Trypanosoma grayi]